MALTREEVASHAAKAGFSGTDLNIAVAVSKAESGWNPKAHADDSDDNSYGLMQINMIGGLGPARRKQFNLKNNEELYDPDVNMRAAYAIYKGAGNSFKPWTTFTSGAYKSHLSSETPTIVKDSPSGKSDPILGVGAALNAFGDTLFKVGANIGGILIAVALLVLGVVIISRNHIPVGKAITTAKKVLK